MATHVVRAAVVGVMLLVLCCIPHIVHQYDADAALSATAGTVGGAAHHVGQGLTLVHFSAQRKHILWDRLGA